MDVMYSKMKVSIVVPSYNSEKYIKECILSIINQSYNNLEILFVDDGSHDETVKIISKYASRDQRITLYKKPHSGVSAARNFGISQASGEYICFIDSDDVVHHNYISNMVRIIKHINCPVVFSKSVYLYEDNKIVYRNKNLEEGKYTFEELANSVIDNGTLKGILFGSACVAIYDLSFIKDNNISFNENLKINEDGIFNLSIIKRSKTIYFTTLDLYYYRKYRRKKIRKNNNIEQEFNKVTTYLNKNFNNFPNFKIQMKRRSVSEIFWIALRLIESSNNLFFLYNNLKLYILKNNNFFINYQYLDFDKIPKQKKILVKLLHKKLFLVFIILLKYFAPFLASKGKR